MAIEHLVQPSWPRCVRGCQAFGKLADLLPACTEGLFSLRSLTHWITHKGPAIIMTARPFRRGNARSNRAVLPNHNPTRPRDRTDKQVTSTHRTIWLHGMHLRFTLFISPARGHWAPISWPLW
jgi:hypothetical protein